MYDHYASMMRSVQQYVFVIYQIPQVEILVKINILYHWEFYIKFM